MLATGSLAKRQMAPASSDSLGSLQRCPVQRHAPSLPRRQRRVATAATLVRQVVVPLAATAALGGLLLTVRRALIARQPAEPQQSRTRQAAARQERREGGSAGGKSGGWPLLPQPPSLQLPAWPGLHNKEQREERQLLSTLDEIERRQVLDTRAELQQWDKRLSLRTQTLGELRALAQKHRIAGRSRMRKRELVSALEAALGFEPLPQPPQEQPPQPPAPADA